MAAGVYVGRREDGEVTLPLGEKPHGSLLYTADGWMTAQICAADRAAMETRDIRGGSNHERVAAFSSYIAYCGSYEVTGDVVVHYVEMSLFPNWVGTEQTRTIELAGDELVLRTRPLEVGGQVLVNELRWRREDE
jgi:hypothetical protein